jgi:hypothetical protein
MSGEHNTALSKTYLIEGWLKKDKAKKGKIFGSQTTRWFVLDIVNATFSYGHSKGKKASKTVALRDIEGINPDPLCAEDEDWTWAFEVFTKERKYFLFAQSKPEREMWCLAFETLLNFRKGDAPEGEGEGEEMSIAEKLKEKESELLKKIEEVDVYRNQKKGGKKSKRNKGRKEVDDGDTGDELELQGEQQENLLADSEEEKQAADDKTEPVEHRPEF